MHIMTVYGIFVLGIMIAGVGVINKLTLGVTTPVIYNILGFIGVCMVVFAVIYGPFAKTDQIDKVN